MRRTGARQVEPADDVPRAPDDRHRQPVSLALDELSRAGEFIDEAGTCDAQRASRRVDLLGELGEHAPPAAPTATRVCPSRHARMSVSLRMTPTRRRCRAGSRRCGWCRRPHARASRRRARSRRRGRSRARPRQRPALRTSAFETIFDVTTTTSPVWRGVPARAHASSTSAARSSPSVTSGMPAGAQIEIMLELSHTRAVRRQPGRRGGGQSTTGNIAATSRSSSVATS